VSLPHTHVFKMQMSSPADSFCEEVRVLRQAVRNVRDNDFVMIDQSIPSLMYDISGENGSTAYFFRFIIEEVYQMINWRLGIPKSIMMIGAGHNYLGMRIISSHQLGSSDLTLVDMRDFSSNHNSRSVEADGSLSYLEGDMTDLTQMKNILMDKSYDLVVIDAEDYRKKDSTQRRWSISSD